MNIRQKGGEQLTQDFDQIYLSCYQVVYRYALTLTRNPSEAEEIAQQTFFQALKKADQFRGDCAIESWLCGIAKNCWISILRKRKHQSDTPPPEPASGSLEEMLLDRERSDQLFQLLHQLEEPYREVFWLRVFGERSFREIAGLFGKTESWARVTYYRARARLQERMDSE